ncbi:MAG: YadA-like family protein, partial [Neisseriaceae bacterium]|nr:YadA-like family protein [Neisseriaceae bacterium]
TLVNNAGVSAKTITGDTVNANTLNAGTGNVFNVSDSTATYNTTVSGDNGKEVANVEYVNKVQTVVEQGKNTVVTGIKNDKGGMTYTVDAYDTKVAAGSGLKMVSSAEPSESNGYVRQYTLGLDDSNQAAIDNAINGLATAVDGNTAQTLDKTNNQANFITGDNMLLTGNANGITIATKKDVKFDSVATGNLKANTAELGATTITGDSTYKGSEIVNKTYADSLGWDLKVNGKKQGDRIVNNGSVNIADGQNTTVEYADGAVKVNAKDTQLTAGDYIQLNNGDADANGVRQYTVSAKTTALTTENGKVKTPSGSDLVTADNMANTLNNLYWTAEATEKANVKAGDTVKFQGEKGIAVSNNGQMFTITNNAQYESEVAGLTLTKDDTTGDVKLTGNVGDLVDGLEPLKFAGDSGDTLQPKFGDTVKIVGDAQNINVLGKDGQLNVGLNKDVVLGNDSDSGSLNVNGDAGSTAIHPNEITFSKNGNINNVATHINPDGTNLSGSNHQAASVQDVLNSGWRIKVGNADAEYVKHNEQVAFIDGKGTSVSGSKAGVAYHINTDPTSQLTINSNNQLTLNTGASSVDAGKAKAEDADSKKIATVGDMVNTINNTYWTATDGQNNTQVKAGDTLTWQGSGSLKVENENGTFTISDKTAYESEVNGLGLSKDGDVVKLTGTLPKDTNTVTAVTTTDSNLKVTPKIDGENREYDIALNKNLDLSDLGSLKVGDTLINNDGMTINNGSQGKPVTLTKNGLDNGGNKISNVATGVADTDAVNVGQLKEAMNDANININQVIYGSDTPRPELLKTYNADSDAVHKTNAVAEAIYNMNEHGIKYFHTHDGSINPAPEGTDTDDSIAKGTFSTAIGYQAKADGESALAIGNGSAATADNSIAIGAGNTVTGEKSIAIGFGHTVSGSRSGAFGDPSKIDGDDSYAVGNDVEIVKGNNKVFVLGNKVKETHSNSVFLGDSSAYTAAGASTAGMDEYSTNAEDIKDVNGNVAIEKGSLKFAGAKPAGVVSVGTVGEERRIQNVAAGLVTADSTDAINGSQLYSVAQQVSKVSNGGAGPVQYSNASSPTIPNGGIKSNDVTLVGADSMQPVTIHNVASGRNPTDAVNVSQLQQATSNLGNRLNDRIDSVSQRSDASAASSIAVASMPQAYMPGKSLISAGGGTYHGQTGYAIGISTISDSGNWILKGTATGNSQKRYGAGIGVGYQW